MRQIPHGCATTTAALRRAIQYSQESLTRLAARYHINAKTVAKWRKRTTVNALPNSPMPNYIPTGPATGGVNFCVS